MVCPRCIDTVRDIFYAQQIETKSIQLGKVVTVKEFSSSQKVSLENELLARGFELLQDDNSKLISQIKTLIIEQIHHGGDKLTVNFSTIISGRLNHEYSSLSRLFSSVEGITIERFVLKQKIEKVKELLFYKQLTLSEIAFQMDYSSVAHLSAQFKKETGMTPSAFKKMRGPGHLPLDSL